MERFLVPLTIASSNSRAETVCAKWYLKINLSEELADTTDICFECPVHASKFQMKEWVTFLQDRCETPSEDPIINDHKSAVDKISQGDRMYHSSCSCTQVQCSSTFFLLLFHRIR